MLQTTQKPYPYRWVILGVLWATYIVVFLHRLSIGPLAPFLKEDLTITSTEVGLVMSSASFGYMITLFLSGWVVDRVGVRWPMAIAELVAGTCMIIVFLTSSYTGLLTFMFVTGLACGFLMPSTSRGVITWFPLRERATAMGFKQTAVNIGGIISASTLPLVALALGWRYGFLFLGMVALAIGVLAIILYKEPPVSISPHPASPEDVDKPVSLLEVLKNRDIWLIAACGLCLSWVEMAMMGHLVLYLTDRLLFSVVAAGGILAVTEAAGAIARPGGGLLSDRVFGGRRKPVFMAMAATAAVMCLLVALLGPYLSWVIYPVLFLLGLAGIGFGGIYFTLLAEFGGRRGTGRAVGLGNTVSMAGSVLGPIVFGYIVDVSGSYQLAWLSLSLIAILCVFLLLPLSEKRRKT